MKLSNGGLSNHILQMLGAGDAAFLLVSADGVIAAQSSGARRLLQQKTLRPVGEILSEGAAQAVRFVLQTGGESTLDEEIDGHWYQLEIRSVEQGALLYFAPANAPKQALPLPLYGQIAGSLSHILALLYLAPGAADDQKQFLDSVRRDSLRIYRGLLHLQLLEYADDPERILHYEEHDLAALCRTLCEKSAAAAAQRGLAAAIHCDVPDRCVFVFDARMLTRAILALLTNALHAPDATEVRLQIRRTETHVTILVSDDGRGLPPAELDRLYHAWQRPQDLDQMLEKQTAGLPYGLGLPLVRRIAGWHGGALLLDAAANHGTVFRLTLPTSLPADPSPLGQFLPEDNFDPIELELSAL